MRLSKIDQLLGELEQPGIDLVPVQPRDLIVLAVRVVVALLRAAEFVARKQHRNAQREEERGEKISLLTRSQDGDLAIVTSRAFHTAIPGTIVGLAVAILLAVVLVMLLVVADEIVQGEPVVRGQKIDAGVGTAATRFVKIRAASQTRCELGDTLIAAAPIVAYAIAIAP